MPDDYKEDKDGYANGIMHVWDSPDGTWTVRMSNSVEVLATASCRERAVDWCMQHADEVGVGVIYVWDAETLKRASAKEGRPDGQ